MLSAGSQSAEAYVCSSYRTSAASQRLNAEHKAWFVGLIEADGWISAKKSGKYIQYELGLEMHKRELPMLHQINNMFQLQGSVYTRKDRPNICLLYTSRRG